jgi:hypothetical protein
MVLALILHWFASVGRAYVEVRAAEMRELLWAQFASMLGVIAIYMFIPIMIQRQYWVLFGLGLAAAWASASQAPPDASLEAEAA